MYRKWIGLLGLLALAFLIVGCADSSSVAKISVPGSSADVPRMTPQDLKGKLDAGEAVLVVDSRSLAEYNQRHIPDALSIPLEEIRARHGELSKDVVIVLYCT